jgi:DNA invertase Pin-like site-specific DNA recombinase
MLELDFKMMMSKLESRNIGARTADGQKNAIKTGRNMFSPPL